MKPTFNSYIAVVLVALVPFFSSCETEMVEPIMPATETTAAASRLTIDEEAKNDKTKFEDGNHIVQFHENPALVTNQDIEALAEEIAEADLEFIEVFNFEGFKGVVCYLTKQQARKFDSDPRVLVVEADGPIIPLGQSR